MAFLADLRKNWVILAGFIGANLAMQLALYLLGPTFAVAPLGVTALLVVCFASTMGVVSTLYHIALTKEKVARRAGEDEASRLRGENEHLGRLLQGVSPRRRQHVTSGLGRRRQEGGCFVVTAEPVAYNLFERSLREDRQGLVFTRHRPEEVWDRLKSPGLPVIWLSRARDPDATTPTNLDLLLRIFLRFRELGGEVVLLDAVEYLVVQNDFATVLKFVHALQDEVAKGSLRVIMHLNPEAFDTRSLALLTRDGVWLSATDTEYVTVSP